MSDEPRVVVVFDPAEKGIFVLLFSLFCGHEVQRQMNAGDSGQTGQKRGGLQLHLSDPDHLTVADVV